MDTPQTAEENRTRAAPAFGAALEKKMWSNNALPGDLQPGQAT